MKTNSLRFDVKVFMSACSLLLLLLVASPYQTSAQTNTFPASGNAGIGTTSPGSILTIQTTGVDVAGEKYPRIKSTNSYSGLLLDPGQAGDAAWLIMGGFPSAGDFTVREYGVANYFTIKKSSGNVGIGTTTPSYLLTLTKNYDGPTISATFNTTNGANAQAAGAVSRTTDFSSKYLSWGVTAPSFSPVGYGETAYLHTSGVPFKLGSLSAHDLLFFTGGISNTRMTITGGGNVGIGTTAPAKKLDVVGDVNVSGGITGGTIQAKYQDVAEWVESSQNLASGTVVVLDQTKSNQVIASAQAYDTRVAGVISLQPGITLGEGGESKVLVATTGRVRVKVDATRCPIRIGDLLVTSDVPGLAMKSEPITISGRQIHSPGTLIGKALEPLEKGTGEILVLLSLQ